MTPAGLAEQWAAWADGAVALGEDAAAGRLRAVTGDDPVGVAYSRLLSGDVAGAAAILRTQPDVVERPAGRLLDAAVAAVHGSSAAYLHVQAAADEGHFRRDQTLRLLATVADLIGDVATADAAWWRLLHETGTDDLRAAVRFGVASVAMRHPGARAQALRTVVIETVVAVARTGRSADARRAAIRRIVQELRGRGDHQGAHLVLAAHLALAEPDPALRKDLRALERAGVWRVLGFVLLTIVCLTAALAMPLAALVPAAVARGVTYPGLGVTESDVRRSLRPRRVARTPARGGDDRSRCRCWYTGTLADQAADDYLALHLVPSATPDCSAAVTEALGPGVTVARCPETSARWLVGPIGDGGAPLALRGLLVRPAVPEDDTLRTGFYL